MLKKLQTCLQKPKLNQKSEKNFWDDDHISKHLLEAHLSQATEGASRNLQTIEDSVSFIVKELPPENYPNLLDLGCGPGLYCERFFKAGYSVTGVDFSKRSIAYAKEHAKRKNLEIAYFYGDYLHFQTENQFDVVTLIYCDYGALSKSDRSTVLKNIYKLLKPGGSLVLDVFSYNQYQSFQELQQWENCPKGGFWDKENHFVLQKNNKFNENTTLEQTVVIKENGTQVYYIWNRYFSEEELGEELRRAGFETVKTFADVTGKAAAGNSKTVAVMVKKVK